MKTIQNGMIYYDENQYEEVEFVDPIINQELTYNLRYDTNDKLKVGNEVRFFLQDENGKRISDYSKFEFYTLVVSAYGNQIVKNKGEQPHFVFTKEMGANVSTYTVCYDTLKAYVPTATSRVYYSSYMIDSYFFYPSETIKLCDEELSL